MNGLPNPVEARLLGQHFHHRPPVWIELDDNAKVISTGGRLFDHGLDDLSPGAHIEPSAHWTAGLLPVGPEPIVVPEVETHKGVYADLHLWREDTSQWLLLVDATERVRERKQALQVANDAGLLREQLEGAERGRVGARRERVEALSALGVEVLERGPDGAFRPAAEAADWLEQLCEWEPGSERILRAEDPSNFLESFLFDSSEFFDRGEPGLVKSDMWAEDSDGIERFFEAIAMVLSTGSRVLAVQRLDERYEERQTLLQRARETSLSFEELRREVQTRDVLLHCIVHDLKGPLAGMVGALSMLRSRDPDGEQRRELLDIALRQSQKQDELIRHVLEVFRAEINDLVRFDEDVASAPDLAQIVYEVAERLRPAFHQAGVHLTTPTIVGRVPVVGRFDQLERILANLLENAMRHTPLGTAIEIEIEPSEDPVLRVLDRGPGVSADLRGHLFERFARGGRGGAAGLGLFYCRMTLERWGGTITYADRPGGGAIFEARFRTPRVPI